MKVFAAALLAVLSDAVKLQSAVTLSTEEVEVQEKIMLAEVSRIIEEEDFMLAQLYMEDSEDEGAGSEEGSGTEAEGTAE